MFTTNKPNTYCVIQLYSHMFWWLIITCPSVVKSRDFVIRYKWRGPHVSNADFTLKSDFIISGNSLSKIHPNEVHQDIIMYSKLGYNKVKELGVCSQMVSLWTCHFDKTVLMHSLVNAKSCFYFNISFLFTDYSSVPCFFSWLLWIP